jgi:hypothetical protein
MRIVNEQMYNLNPLEAERIEILAGTAAPGTQELYVESAVGSTYWRKVAEGHTQRYVKVMDNNRADDWVVAEGIISQRVAYTDFTDGGGAAGTLALANQIPSGAKVTETHVTNVTGFAGDTSAVIIVGVAAGDTDRYNTGTPSIFTTVDAAIMGIPSGIREHTAATTVTVTVTSAADFTAVNAGAFTIHIFYRK